MSEAITAQLMAALPTVRVLNVADDLRKQLRELVEEAAGHKLNNLHDAAKRYVAALKNASQPQPDSGPAARCVELILAMEARRALEKHAGPISLFMNVKAASAAVVAAGVDNKAISKAISKRRRTPSSRPTATWQPGRTSRTRTGVRSRRYESPRSAASVQESRA